LSIAFCAADFFSIVGIKVKYSCVRKIIHKVWLFLIENYIDLCVCEFWVFWIGAFQSANH